MNRLDEVTATKAEMTETAQTFAKVSVYADQRIGEILRELPTGHGNRFSDTSEPLKADAIADAGIPKSQAYDLQKLAANPDVVQAVLDKAEAEGRIPSRKQVLDAIKERDDARETVSMVKKVSDELKRERDEAREDNEQYKQDVKDLQEEIRALEKQNDQLFEKANAAQEPRVITREVVPKKTQERLEWLEHLEQVHTADNQKLRKQLEESRKKLEHANALIG
jgi:chromosome segregation ATPase